MRYLTQAHYWMFAAKYLESGVKVTRRRLDGKESMIGYTMGFVYVPFVVFQFGASLFMVITYVDFVPGSDVTTPA